MCMKHISGYLLFAVAIPSFCCADVTKLSPEDRKVLQNSSRVHEVYSTSDLPPAIMTLCGAKLADPGPEVERDRCNYRSKASGQAPHLDGGRAATFTLCITSAVELRTRLTFGYETGEGRRET